MNPEELQQIGFTRAESRAYIALLELGTSSVGPIINRANISRSKIYDVLNRLIGKGVVGTVSVGKTQKYKAVSPDRIRDFLSRQHETLAEREAKFAELLPQLRAIEPQTETAAELLVGPRAIKAFFDSSLTQNPARSEILVLGYSREASLYFHAYFRDYHKARIKRKIPGRVIYDYETWFLKDREKRKFVQQRYLPRGTKTPAFVYIWADIVGTIVFTKDQKLCFMIKNKEVAASYRAYFNMVWQQAVKTGK